MDPLELVDIALILEEAATALHCHHQAALGEVVAAALDEHRRKLARHHRLDQRNVLPDKLLLKRDGVGGDHDPARPAERRRGPRGIVVTVGVGLACRRADRLLLFLIGGGRQDGGDQVGKAFADAGAGLDDEVTPVADRGGHQFGHLQLLRPGFPSWEPGG